MTIVTDPIATRHPWKAAPPLAYVPVVRLGYTRPVRPVTAECSRCHRIDVITSMRWDRDGARLCCARSAHCVLCSRTSCYPHQSMMRMHMGEASFFLCADVSACRMRVASFPMRRERAADRLGRLHGEAARAAVLACTDWPAVVGLRTALAEERRRARAEARARREKRRSARAAMIAARQAEAAGRSVEETERLAAQAKALFQ